MLESILMIIFFWGDHLSAQTELSAETILPKTFLHTSHPSDLDHFKMTNSQFNKHHIKFLFFFLYILGI